MNVVRHRRWFFLISAFLVLPAIAAVIYPPFGLRPGIEFTGGTAMTVEFQDSVKTVDVRDRIENLGHDGAIVQSLGDRSYFIRVGELEPQILNDEGNIVIAGGRKQIEDTLSHLSPVDIVGFDAISAVVGSETVRNAIIAVIIASIAVLFYVSWAFRRVPSPFRYGTVAIVALIHDVLLVLGLFALLGKIGTTEVNAMFITGVLTVIGYSVNDTIVIFDRIRENVLRHSGSSLIAVVNLSVRETIGRSLNTSLTLVTVIVALLLFGGPTIQSLLLVLLVGVIVGTYSSIFVASLLLVAWETGEFGRALRRLPLVGGRR